MHNLREGGGPHQGTPHPRRRPHDLIDEEGLFLSTARGQRGRGGLWGLTGALLVHLFLTAKMAKVRRVPMMCPTSQVARS